MLDQITDEMLTIAIVVVGSLTAIVLFAYVAIFISPQIAINPFPPPLPTATTRLSGLATFPPTWTPVSTATNTPTPSATPTRTPQPFSTLGTLPTNTPIPLDQLLPPGITASPTAAAQPPAAPTFPPATPAAPPPPAPPPAPPATPVPLYVRLRMLGGSNCNWLGMYGFIYNQSGQAMGGVNVHVHNDYGYVRDVTTSGNGRWEVFLDSRTRDDLASGLWHVAVTENGQNASDEVAFALSTDCNAGIQRVQID